MQTADPTDSASQKTLTATTGEHAYPVPGKTRTSDPSQWLELHGDAMFRFALLRAGSREMAEEAVQEAMLAALKARSSFDGRSTERTWLIGILRHKLIDQVRQRKREADLTIAADTNTDALFDDGIWASRPQEWDATALNVESREFQRVLGECIERLPTPMRRAFCLRVLDGVASDIVCKDMGVSTTNLWTIVHRAKLRLRMCLTSRWFRGESD